MPVLIKSFFHRPTSTFSYVVADPASETAAIVDPVMDFDPSSGKVWTEFVEGMIRFIESKALKLDWVLETHVHADHLSASSYLRDRFGARVGIGEGVTEVQRTFRAIYNLGPDFVPDGRHFDRLFSDGDTIQIGNLEGKVMRTPGHTSDSVTYVFGDAAFIGDTMFRPGYGTARCDFPGGDAALLYESIHRIYSLGDATRLFLCHDYPPTGEEPRCETTVSAQRQDSVHVSDGVSEQAFVEMRLRRDAELSMPKLILPAIQVNIRAGALPPAEDDGVSYLKLPLNRF